jgi:hypothetical protein
MVRVSVGRALVGFTAPCALCVLMFSCSSPKPATNDPRSSALWGDMKGIVSVKELMRDMIEPAAYNIFDSISIRITSKGRVTRVPQSDEDWDRIRFGAVTLLEGVYLLKVRRPFTPPGVENEAGELPPQEILAKVEKDPVLWDAKIEAIRNVGLEVVDVVKNKRTEELWDAGDNLERACESCHELYWYPDQPRLMREIDRKLEALYGPRAKRVP